MFRVLPSFDYRVAFAVQTDLGGREVQQDVALVLPEHSLFAVADGMGGHAAGGMAAALAIDEVRARLESRRAQRRIAAYVARGDLEARRGVFECLRQAVEAANERVRMESDRDPARAGMATTLDVVWLARECAFVAHVGDGRVYLSRATATLQLTQDHGERAVADARGRVRPQRGARGWDRLLNAVGLSPTVVVDTLFVELGRGDRVLICTDGVHGPIGDEADLARRLRAGGAAEAAAGLVAEATRTGRDNATAVVVQIGDRFVARAAGERGLASGDLGRARACALLADLGEPEVLAALAAAVEVELAAGASVPRVVANDLVAYVVLDGRVSAADGRELGCGSLIFPESLLGVGCRSELPVITESARMLRIRTDDFEEVCASDASLGRCLYRRLGEHIARLAVRGIIGSVPPESLVEAANAEAEDPPA